MSYILFIAGSRNFDCNNNSEYRDKANYCLDKVINEFGIPYEIVHGNARGADRTVTELFLERNLQPTPDVKKFNAQWDLYGKRAGFLRNKEMQEYLLEKSKEYTIVTCVFYNPKTSKGSINMVNLIDTHLPFAKRFYVIDHTL